MHLKTEVRQSAVCSDTVSVETESCILGLGSLLRRHLRAIQAPVIMFNRTCYLATWLFYIQPRLTNETEQTGNSCFLKAAGPLQVRCLPGSHWFHRAQTE